jgi:hypothetical protein
VREGPVVVDTRSAHFLLGADKPSFETTSSEFTWKEGSADDARSERERQNKVTEESGKTHFSFGSEGGDFSTTTGASFAWKGSAYSAAEVDKERERQQTVMTELRKAHFALGFADRDFGTTAGSDFRQHAVERRTLKLKYTHGTSFKLGFDDRDFVSEQMATWGQTERSREFEVPKRTGDWTKDLKRFA